MNIGPFGIKNLGEALSKFQEEVKNPANSAVNPQFRSKYAPLDVVINTIKPVLAKNGLSFIQSTGSEGENISVTTLLIHESGEWIESDPLILPAYQIKGGGAKEFNAQGAGSALTYARRYSLSAFLGLSSEDDDDANGQVFGGNASQQTQPSTPPAPNAREVAKTKAEAAKAEREAAAKAVQEKIDSNKPDATPVPPTEDTSGDTSGNTSGDTVEPINDGQLKAISQMLKMVSKKKAGFDDAQFLKTELAKYSASEINELTFEQGKELLTEINAEMRKK